MQLQLSQPVATENACACRGGGQEVPHADVAPLAQSAAPAPDRCAVSSDDFDPALPFRDAKQRAIERWERWYVGELLRHTGGNLSEAARVARTDRGHLRKLVRKYSP